MPDQTEVNDSRQSEKEKSAEPTLLCFLFLLTRLQNIFSAEISFKLILSILPPFPPLFYFLVLSSSLIVS